MAEADPSCPRCTGPVRPDWDWCMNCGYDPEGLKPPGWTPGPPPVEPEPPKGRRGRRAAKAAVVANRSAAIDLRAPLMPALVTAPPRTPTPAAPSAPGAETAPMAPVRPPAPATRPAPSPAPARTAPARTAPAVTERAPAVRARTDTPDLPFTASDGTARAGARLTPAVGASTTTFSLPPNRLDLAAAVVVALAGAGMALVAVASIGSLAGGTVLNKAVTALFILLCVGIAAGLAAQAYALVKVKVVIGPDELVATNRLGRPRRADLAEIFSVTLSTRHYDVGLGRHHSAEMPYVQVTDGAGFWIDALGGRSGEDPTPDQLAVLDQLHQVVARYRVAPPTS